jgi:hypothetical protein
MGGWLKRGPFSYRNIPLACKGHAIAPFSANRRKITVKICHKPLSSIHHFKVNLSNNDSSTLL